MKAGRISEQGTHAQLMMQRGIYYSLVKRQAGDGTLGTREEEEKVRDLTPWLPLHRRVRTCPGRFRPQQVLVSNLPC